jgi:hypothetical protein
MEIRLLTIVAVVIIDPPLGDNVRYLLTNELRKVTTDAEDPEFPCAMQYPSLTSSKDLPEDIESWADLESTPDMLSLFDEMLKVYSKPGYQHQTTDNPVSCTVVFRQLNLSLWIGFLDKMRRLINSMHFRLKLMSTRDFTWVDPLFTDFEFLKSDLEFQLIFLYRNMKALQVKAAEAGEGFITRWETDEWRFAEARILSYQRTVESTTEVYSHAAEGEGMRSANAQSNSVARLTGLATVFVPLSLIAAIFSIGGDYAVGGARFWVYFVVSVPVGLIISLFLFTNVRMRMIKFARSPISSMLSVMKRCEMWLRGKRGRLLP